MTVASQADADQTQFDQQNALFFRDVARQFLQARVGASFSVGWWIWPSGGCWMRW